MLRHFKLGGIGILLFPTLLCAQDIDTTKRAFSDPMVWDDLVARGRVVAVENGTVSASKWYTPAMVKYHANETDVEVTSLKVSVTSPLRGKLSPGEVTFLHHRYVDPRDELLFNRGVKAGDSIIVTAAYVENLDGGWIWRSIFVKNAAGWSHFVPGAGWSEAEPENHLVARAQQVGMKEVTLESDLVIKGTIESRKVVENSPTQDQEYVVRPISTIKGVAAGDVVVHALGGISSDESRWREFLSFQMEPGSLWYLFLKRKGDVYVPVAGRQSAFLMKDGRLLEALTVPSKYNSSELERDVRQFSSQ